jgi:3-methyladenine DNA glycosylase AlkD
MKELESLGTNQNKKIYLNHGADIELFGVSVANLKKVAKTLKNNHDVGMKLLYSGNADAIYLSQWVVDPKKLTIGDYEKILDSTNYYMIIESTIAPLVARNPEIAFDCLYKWIDSDQHRYRQAAYFLLSIILGSYDNELIDMEFISKRLEYVEKNIQMEENRVKYAMNNFVIASGISLPSYTQKAIDVSINAGKVNVDMGKTSCNVPVAHKYIKFAESKNKLGIKRKLK